MSLLAAQPSTKRCALRVHLRLDLLAHRAAQQVGLAEAVAGEHLRRLHHLFLVDEDAVGFLEHAFEHRVRVSELGAAVLAVAEHRDVVHRARPVERDERDDVAERGRAHRRERAPHAFGFELEHADRVAALEQFVDLRIVPRRAWCNRPRCRCSRSRRWPSLSTDSVLRPRKSNFTSPAASTYFMSNWVTGMSERGSR